MFTEDVKMLEISQMLENYGINTKMSNDKMDKVTNGFVKKVKKSSDSFEIRIQYKTRYFVTDVKISSDMKEIEEDFIDMMLYIFEEVDGITILQNEYGDYRDCKEWAIGDNIHGKISIQEVFNYVIRLFR